MSPPAVLLLPFTVVGCLDTAAPTLDAPHSVASVMVQPAAASVNVGKHVSLSATVLDPSGAPVSGQAVTWTVQDSAVASVSPDGDVTAKRVGSTLVTAVSANKSGTATITVLPPPVASIDLSPTSVTIAIGDAITLVATPHDETGAAVTGRPATWASADPTIATVSASGRVTGVKTGTTKITVTIDGVSASATVTVATAAVATVSVSPTSVSIAPGATTQLAATTRDARGAVLTGRAISWSSSNTAVATVSSSGVVTGVAEGSATITATSEGKHGTSTVSVTKAPVASVKVSPTSVSLQAGATAQLTATPLDQSGQALTGRTITWSTGSTAVATVSSTGLVKGVAQGTTTITAYCEGKSAPVAVTVTATVVPVATVSVSPGADTLIVGQSGQFTATPKDGSGNALSGRTITWTSSNTGIATVTSTGAVRAVAAGTATITATSEGKSGTATLLVKPVPVAAVSVTPSSASVQMGSTVQLSARTSDASGNTLTGRTVTWSTSNSGVAMVSGSGLVTATGAGSATITATSEGKSGTASITVASTSTSHSGWYVSPNGSSSGSGSSSSPWSLATAFAGGNGKIQPGDTVWLRGGTYRGSFHPQTRGTASAPIIFRQYPGERATIDGNLSVDGQYTWFWGFELTSSTTSNTNLEAITSHCPGCRFINLVIHDESGSGLGLWSEGPDQEAYGNILYNIGYYAPGATEWAHGIYAQNQTGTKRLINNLLFDTFGYGFHIYGSDAAYLRNFTIDGNLVVNSGLGSGMDYQIGGNVPVENLTFTHNMSYRSPGQRYNTARIGYGWDSPVSSGATVTDNYFVGQVMISHWSSLTFQRNTVIDPSGALITLELASGQSTTTGSWGSNNYFKTTSGSPFALVNSSGGHGYTLSGWQQATGLDGSSTLTNATPTSTKVVVQPNQYEAGRANVIIFNWGHQGSVSVDLSGVLKPGEAYEVRNAQNFFGAPVTSATYGGGTVTLPITSITPPTSIVGKTGASTGTELNVYVVLKK
ncbi:MAG: Ig-like domain-containing protein [Gemmatimonadaceae bacterium]|nr:Ig-like domain-containing protein [Gemmatimonadaceae bacterium]